MISVVIPARNAGATLGVQLDALRTQSYRGDWELLVVDNGSTDDTAQIALATAADLPVRVVHEPRAGTNLARRAGVEAAHGDFVLFVDADDVVTPTWLEAMARAVGDADAVCGPLDRAEFIPASQLLPGSTGMTDGLIPWSGFLPFAPGANFGVRTSVYHALGGFDPTYAAGGDDVEFSWRLQLGGHTITFVPDALVLYRSRSRLRDVARQFYCYGLQDPHLYRDFRRQGMPGIPVAQTVSSFGYLTVKAPQAWTTPAGRRHWLRSASRRVGRARGSVRWRARYV